MGDQKTENCQSKNRDFLVILDREITQKSTMPTMVITNQHEFQYPFLCSKTHSIISLNRFRYFQKKKKGLGKGTLAAMQEALRIKQEMEEEERKKEEERIRKEEEAERERLEKLRIEEEKKELKKQREKERKEKLRAEGLLLTKKQRQEKARAEQMIAAMRAQGLDVPEKGVPRGPRPGTRIRYGLIKKM